MTKSVLKNRQPKNAREIGEDFVQNRVVEWLSQQNWRIIKSATLREKGVDIKARHTRYSRYYLIECKGSKDSSSEEVAFMYSLGQIIIRMNTSKSTRYYYGIALPENAAKKALKRIPFQICKKLLLHIFSIDKKGKVTRYMPKDIEKHQTAKV